MEPTPPTSTTITTTTTTTTNTNEVMVVDGEAIGRHYSFWNDGESFNDFDLYIQHGVVTGIKVGTGNWINSIQAKYIHTVHSEL